MYILWYNTFSSKEVQKMIWAEMSYNKNLSRQYECIEDFEYIETEEDYDDFYVYISEMN